MTSNAAFARFVLVEESLSQLIPPFITYVCVMGRQLSLTIAHMLQEEYEEGDDLGKIDCGHSYHVACIKQWLLQKNQCPICKASALS